MERDTENNKARINQKKEDVDVESVISQYLDKYYYRVILNDDDRIERISGEDKRNINGSDIVVTRYPGTHKEYSMNLDEKAQLYYINHPLPTFALEILFINTYGNLQEGWFIDDTKNTTDYLFIWPRSNKEIDTKRGKKEGNKQGNPKTLNQLSIKDIDFIECMRVNKKKLQEYIQKKTGISIKDLKKKASELKNTVDSELKNKINPANKMELFTDKTISNRNNYFCYSYNLKEKPVNMVVDKKILMMLSEAHYLVNEEGVWSIMRSNTPQSNADRDYCLIGIRDNKETL